MFGQKVDGCCQLEIATCTLWIWLYSLVFYGITLVDTVAGGTRPRQGVLQPLVGPGVQQGCQQHPSSQLRSKLNPPITCQLKLTDKFSEIKHSVKFSKKIYTKTSNAHTSPPLHHDAVRPNICSLAELGEASAVFLLHHISHHHYDY